MKRVIFSLLSLVLVGLPVCPAPGHAAAAPDRARLEFFQGYGYQPGLYSRSSPQPLSFNWGRQSRFSGPAANTAKWNYATGDIIASSPAIGPNDLVYVGSKDGKLYAFDLVGSKKWEFTTGGPVPSSPAIASDGSVYFGSYDGRVYALNPDGSQKWVYDAGYGGIFSSPAIGRDGTIYIGTGKLLAMNPDGQKKWEFPAGNTLLSTNSSPAIGDNGAIYYATNTGILYAVNEDGSKRWEFNIGSEIGNSSPAICTDGTVLIGAADKKLHAIDPSGPKEKWFFSTGGSLADSSAAVTPGSIYVGSQDKKLYAIDYNGKKFWEYSTGGSIISTPLISSDATLYVGSYDNKLYAVTLGGKLKWKFSTGGRITSSPSLGADGTLYFGSWDRKMYALGASSSGAKLQLTSPNDKTDFPMGSTQKITWKYTGKPGSNVKIDLYRGNAPLINIAPAASMGGYGAGSFNWVIPTQLEAGGGYRIRITSTSNNSLTDMSDNHFNLLPLLVTAPKSGASFPIGSTCTIAWSYYADPGVAFDLLLFKNGPVCFLANTDSGASTGSGSYSWKIPADIAVGSDYRIGVCIRGTNCCGMSNSFTITPLQVLSPNGGEAWSVGSTQKINWSYAGEPGVDAKVKIELLKGGKLNSTLCSSTSIGNSGAGSWNWTLPANLAPGSNYQVRITVIGASYSDCSDKYFSIKAARSVAEEDTTIVPHSVYGL